MDQCHSVDVARADGPWEGPAPRVDALVTTRGTTSPSLLCPPTACPSCSPIRSPGSWQPSTRAGPGWSRGSSTARSTPSSRPGPTPRETLAVVGPSVCGRCYEVPEGMRAEAAAVSPPSATVSWTGTPAIDVAAGVVDQLSARGIRVTWVPGCTRESPDLYSYRRDGSTGRFAGIVRLLPEGGS